MSDLSRDLKKCAEEMERSAAELERAARDKDSMELMVAAEGTGEIATVLRCADARLADLERELSLCYPPEDRDTLKARIVELERDLSTLNDMRTRWNELVDERDAANSDLAEVHEAFIALGKAGDSACHGGGRLEILRDGLDSMPQWAKNEVGDCSGHNPVEDARREALLEAAQRLETAEGHAELARVVGHTGAQRAAKWLREKAGDPPDDVRCASCGEQIANAAELIVHTCAPKPEEPLDG